jgi:ribosomal protein S18 acetylase RimI-like enzyme
MMNCYIQELCPKDAHAVLPLIKKIFPQANIKIDESDLFFVAIHKGRLIGFLHVNEKENCFILKGIGIDEQYRNSGNGSDLMEKVEELSRTTEKKVLLKVKSDNPAVLLYERFGFCLKNDFGPTYTLVKKINN